MNLYKTILSNFSRNIGTHPALPGLYHYQQNGFGGKSRIHLRIDQDGSGLLFVNANRIMNLNQTAAFMAYLALEKYTIDKAIRAITLKYNVSADIAKEDFRIISEKINELSRPDGACPIHDLDLEIITPFSTKPSAPYRMDLALTYRCNNDCHHCYNARPRDFKELTTSDWIIILDKIWELGIPHVVFTGGESTLRKDLPDLISHSEKNGQITGLNTNGRRLQDRSYLNNLLNAGLDHVQITVESHDPSIHDQMVNKPGAWKQTIKGLENVLDSPLYVMTNTTMLRQNSPVLSDTLHFLSSLGVPTVGLNALIYSGKGLTVGSGLSESELFPLLDIAKNHTSANNQRLIWYTPTQYCHFDPMQLELGVKGCTAAQYNMCVEPDGGVLPCQSYYYQLGNILTDTWTSIWDHDLSKTIRERKYIPENCVHCKLLTECGGGCPLAFSNPPHQDLVS